MLAAMLRAHPEAAPVALDGATALRWEVESPAGPEGDPPAAKRVEVHVPVPGDERRWLSVVLTAARPPHQPEARRPALRPVRRGAHDLALGRGHRALRARRLGRSAGIARSTGS
ncbi:hypothetical protein GCM10025868_16430 [Angustibacter aerolatus]|uniref:Uncharacterized protein n=1 Tax=Angustibacter aerolatus TaxID=1162965 RepID=A0ABQ6JDY6_9ACTN|nr:hypothetical protein GCM10025868_16430 [Angustibacter aerolatus]